MLAVIDVLLVLPPVILVLVLATGWGGVAPVIVLTTVLTGAPFLARLARAATLEVSRAPFVQVSMTQRDSTFTTLRREVLPHVDGLCVEDRDGRAILRGITFSLRHGDRLGIVGESGAGKTTLALALLGHFRPGLRCTAGSVRVAQRDVLASSQRALRACRRKAISYLGQDPAAALTPSVRIGDQVRELLHGDRAAATARARLAAVGLPSDGAFARRYPHEASGGQLQRVAIARALAPTPTCWCSTSPRPRWTWRRAGR